MIPKPKTGAANLSSAPWASLAMLLLYLLIHIVVQRDELQQQQALADWYQQSGLFELEWENYISWLRISGQISKAERLETARSQGNGLTVFRAMAFDPAFERENQIRGDMYWDYDQQALWQKTRETFSQRAAALPSLRFGLNPTAPRPSTYLTWHFFNDSIWVWLVTVLVMAPFIWPVEAEIGRRKMVILWVISGVIAGLVYVALLSSRYTPLTGSTPMAAAVVGMYLGLFGRQKLDFLWFHPKQKQWLATPLPAAIPAALVLVLPVFEFFAGSFATDIWLAQLAALVAGVGLVQMAKRAEVRGLEQQQQHTDEGDEQRQLNLKLTSAWSSMSALALNDAERQFEQVLEQAPELFLPLTGLYHIRKLQPDSPAFHDTATRALSAVVTDTGELRQQYTLYRDYLKRLGADGVIPLPARINLISRFCDLGEIREADKLVQQIEKSREQHPQLPKALTRLAQAVAKSDQSRSQHLRTLATRLLAEGEPAMPGGSVP